MKVTFYVIRYKRYLIYPTLFMKKIIIAPLVLLAVIISCNTGKNKSSILQMPDDIKADEYSINIDRDTTLVTKNGALLKIPKGSLSTDNGSTVILEIKEAYSLEQMMRAGLTTKANGELLSSGGMIYINAKGGQNVTIKQAIKVAIPSDYLRDSMQLFKGEKDKNGNINWANPAALAENKQLTAIEEGKQLFQRNCASCHAIGKDMTGPDLAHFLKRFPFQEGFWGYRLHIPHYYQYPDSVIKKDSVYDDNYRNILSNYFEEIYFCNLKSMYGTIGTEFPGLSRDNLDKIYRYIQNESDKLDLPLPSHAYLNDCTDSCYQYRILSEELEIQKELAKQKKDSLKKDNGDLVIEKNVPANSPGTSQESPVISPPVDFDEKVSPENYEAEYYQFTIETFGWFNIDILIKGYDGVEESELFVRIVGQYREKVQVYLIIPSVKVNVQGGPAERNPEEFAFQYKNGKISLPQNEKAYILAVTERESSIAFALKGFTTSTKQEFEITLQKSSKEEFSEVLKSFSPPDMNIKVADAKNADEIRKTNSDLKTIDEKLKKTENLKPKNCDCDCSTEGHLIKTEGPVTTNTLPISPVVLQSSPK